MILSGCQPYVGCFYNVTLPWTTSGMVTASFYYSTKFSNDFGIHNASYNPTLPPCETALKPNIVTHSFPCCVL